MRSADRPLSPHLQIYRWQLTSVLSILHRATGVALSVGTILLVWWLVPPLPTGPKPMTAVQDFLGSWIGLLLLFGWSLSLFYHLCNGIRHLVWDTGHALDLKSDLYRRLGRSSAATAVLTVVSLGRRDLRAGSPEMTDAYAAPMRSPLGRAIGLGSAKEGVDALVGAARHRDGAGAADAVVRHRGDRAGRRRPCDTVQNWVRPPAAGDPADPAADRDLLSRGARAAGGHRGLCPHASSPSSVSSLADAPPLLRLCRCRHLRRAEHWRSAPDRS